jgi:hypothetical protein
MKLGWDQVFMAEMESGDVKVYILGDAWTWEASFFDDDDVHFRHGFFNAQLAMEDAEVYIAKYEETYVESDEE